ncbi:hypothetical protein DPSP01_014715, partial [Paraphaeosphaeria sporulosa]
MESEVNNACQTRRSDRAPTKTPKAAELGGANTQAENSENNADDITEIDTDAPGAPRAKRTRSITSTTRGKGYSLGKGKDATTKQTLASILEALEELKDNNTDLRAAVGELTSELAYVKAQLAETKQQLTEATKTISTLSTIGSDTRTDGSSPRSYASVLARSAHPSSAASRSTSANTNDVSSRNSSRPGLTIDTRRAKDPISVTPENASDIETKIRSRI